ncbi:MAG: hypothetical protein KAJ21_04955 [Thermoplasmatales archaeon]|nr:hypothetical protein [Thermoplasmatales archaeon]
MKNKIITIFAIMILLICFIIPASSTRINFSNEIRISRLSNESTEFSNLNLELGDIVWRWVDGDIFPLFQFFMHPLMVTDIIGDEYEFIESNGAEDVWVRTETEEWIVDNNIFDFVYRLKEGIASYSDIQSAINFAKSQEGKKFAPLFDIYTGTFHVKNSNPDDPNDYLSDDWYCTELIWAAFYNQGIDIDYNGGDFIIPIDIHLSPIFNKIDLID